MIHFITDNVLINCVFLKMNLFALECTEANISIVSFFLEGGGGDSKYRNEKSTKKQESEIFLLKS